MKKTSLFNTPIKKANLEDKNALVETLFEEVVDGYTSTIQTLIRKSGVDVNSRAPNGGKTPLHVACEVGREDVVNVLINNNADIHATTDEGFTPLHVAAIYDHPDLIDILAKTGGNVNAQNKVGTTPLHEAAARGKKNAVVKLLELNANPSIKDNRYNLTAANLAHENNHTNIRDIIIDKMSYSQRFIQNINYILFNWKRHFLNVSQEYRLIDNLSKKIASIENADEVFKAISTTLNSAEYEDVKEKLLPMRSLLITNMKQYNSDKTEAIKLSSATIDANIGVTKNRM